MISNDTISLKAIIDEDMIQYKKCSMFLGSCVCDFKCARDGNFPVSICQNSALATSPIITLRIEYVIKRYLENPLSSAIVFGGLEPFKQFNELYDFIEEFRKKSDDDIVIYTGYYPEEIAYKLKVLQCFKNIIIKFGRYIPNKEKHFDEVLGVNLASDNQYGITLEDAICQLK